MPTLTTAQARAMGIQIPGKRKRLRPNPPKFVDVTAIRGELETATICGIPRATPNSRMHHHERARWTKPFVSAGMNAASIVGIDRACRVAMTRHSPGRLDDDNLAACLKPIRDGIAKFAGVDDGDPRWDWQPRQEKCKRGDECVVVSIK